ENITINAITVGSNTASGRIHEILIHYSTHVMDPETPKEMGGPAPIEFRALNSQEFRKLLGFDRVKSTNFSFTLNEKGLDLKGRGHGHGAGMCQKGARFMA